MKTTLYCVEYSGWRTFWESSDIERVQQLLENYKTVEEIEALTGSKCTGTIKMLEHKGKYF